MAIARWKNGVSILTGVYVSRMLGMFMVFPVLSLYAQGLSGGNAFLAGIALGAYGFTQGILQIPFGWLSDRFGRKVIILLGLALFLIGTIIAATAHSVHLLIVGRAVQGMGAISSVTLAYATDISPPEKRGVVMAIIGGSIGLAFVFALILGPLITDWTGSVAGLFWVIAVLVSGAIVATLFLPSVQQAEMQGENYERRKLWQACFSVFMLHATFTGAFTTLPGVMLKEAGLAADQLWWIYLPANIIAMGFMRYKAHPHPLNFAVSFVIMAIAYAILAPSLGFWGLTVGITVFFIGFYRLETGLPHWVSQFADPQSRGRAMGIFSTAQFVGSFVGAALCGALLQSGAPYQVFVVLLLLCGLTTVVLLWLGKKDTLTHHSKCQKE